MAGASTKNTQAQMRQVPQGTWPQSTVQKQPLHPMAEGGTYTPPQLPTLPIPSTNLQNPPKENGVVVNIGKFSLLAIAFSLILFGAFTFLGGFLLGMWTVKPAPSVYFQETPALGLIPPPSTAPQGAFVLPQKNEILKPFVEKAGDVAESAITEKQLADKVPEFLAPLVKNTQSSIGQQMSDKVEEQVGSNLNQLSQPQSINSPRAPMGAPPHQLHSGVPLQGNMQLPTAHPTVAPSPAEHSNATSHEEDGLYTIQLGVYAAKDNAYVLVNHLQALNYTSQVTEGKAPDGGILYYVHSGLYQDYNTALGAASQFASIIPGAAVMKISSTKKSAS